MRRSRACGIGPRKEKAAGTLSAVERHLLTRYGSKEGALAYRHKYERSLSRRLSNRRELGVVDRALDEAGVRGRVLDCPCGAGRMTPTILAHADHVTAVDLSEAMVDEARSALAPLSAGGRLDFAVASVDDLSFEDAHFDAAVCHRLIHHIADPAQRARVFAELARVTKGSVVMSFSDATTFKHRLQSRRGRKRRRVALDPEQLREEAGSHGLVLRDRPRRLNGLFSLVAVVVFDVARKASDVA